MPTRADRGLPGFTVARIPPDRRDDHVRARRPHPGYRTDHGLGTQTDARAPLPPRRRRAELRAWPKPSDASKTATTTGLPNNRRRYRPAGGGRDPHRPGPPALAAFFDETVETLVVPQLVIVEAGYLVGKLLGPAAQASFLRELADSSFELRPFEHDKLVRMAALVETYADLRLGTVDACVIATAERLGVATIATLDRRHFAVVRRRSGRGRAGRGGRRPESQPLRRGRGRRAGIRSLLAGRGASRDAPHRQDGRRDGPLLLADERNPGASKTPGRVRRA